MLTSFCQLTEGVLNHDKTQATAPSGALGVSDKPLKILKRIVEQTGAKIVLASSWRHDRLEDNDSKYYFAKDFNYLLNKFKDKIGTGFGFYDFTPAIDESKRGQEILAWLGGHNNIESWAVLDDIRFPDYDRREFDGHLVITNYHIGLTDEDADRVIEILGGLNE